MVVADIALGSSAAAYDLLEASIAHIVRKLSVRIYSVVIPLDTIAVVHSKLRVVLSLGVLINDGIDQPKRVEVDRITRHASVLDLLVLFVEVPKEGRAIMTAIRFCE